MALAGAMREWRRKRELDRWHRANAYPPTIQRTYRSTDEFARDKDRLTAAGYAEVLEEEAEPSVDVSPTPSLYGRGPSGRLVVENALFHVTYERRRVG